MQGHVLRRLTLIVVAGVVALLTASAALAGTQQAGHWVRGDARLVGGTTANYTPSLGPTGGTVALRVQTNAADNPGQAVLNVAWEPPPSVMTPSDTEALQVSLDVSSLVYEGNFSSRFSATAYRGTTYLNWATFPFVDMSCTSGTCSTTPHRCQRRFG